MADIWCPPGPALKVDRRTSSLKDLAQDFIWKTVNVVFIGLMFIINRRSNYNVDFTYHPYQLVLLLLSRLVQESKDNQRG
jgi:hypothetical protein